MSCCNYKNLKQTGKVEKNATTEVLPTYGGTGFDFGAPSCPDGYKKLSTAYGASRNNCNGQYVQKLCGGGLLRKNGGY
jgi:hypothetical protein